MDPKIISALQNANSDSQLKAAIDAVPREEQYYTERTRKLLLEKQKLIVDSPTADSVASFLRSFALPDDKRPLLRTAEIRDLFVKVLAPEISSGDPVEKLGFAVCKIVQGEPPAELYSTSESFKAILSCFHRATTAESARWIASSVNNIILYNPSAKKLLDDLPVVEAFSALLPFATSDEAVKWVANALEQILDDNDEGQLLFGTPTILRTIQDDGEACY